MSLHSRSSRSRHYNQRAPDEQKELANKAVRKYFIIFIFSSDEICAAVKVAGAVLFLLLSTLSLQFGGLRSWISYICKHLL